MLIALLLAGVLTQDPGPRSQPVSAAPSRPFRVLVYTHSAGFEHDVVRRVDGNDSVVERSLSELGKKHDELEVVLARDTSWLQADSLERLNVVLFFTTGELPFEASQREALLSFVRRGGGFVGVHSATDTFYEYEPYLAMVGGAFDGHPWHESVRLLVEDTEHPATRHLGASFEITDEIYQFRAPYDRERLHVLLKLDVEGLDLKKDAVNRTDGDFALAWCRSYGRGRVFYTALGHRPEVWADARFREHLLGGLRWASGRSQPPE